MLNLHSVTFHRCTTYMHNHAHSKGSLPMRLNPLASRWTSCDPLLACHSEVRSVGPSERCAAACRIKSRRSSPHRFAGDQSLWSGPLLAQAAELLPCGINFAHGGASLGRQSLHSSSLLPSQLQVQAMTGGTQDILGIKVCHIGLASSAIPRILPAPLGGNPPEVAAGKFSLERRVSEAIVS